MLQRSNEGISKSKASIPAIDKYAFVYYRDTGEFKNSKKS